MRGDRRGVCESRVCVGVHELALFFDESRGNDYIESFSFKVASTRTLRTQRHGHRPWEARAGDAGNRDFNTVPSDVVGVVVPLPRNIRYFSQSPEISRNRTTFIRPENRFVGRNFCFLTLGASFEGRR